MTSLDAARRLDGPAEAWRQRWLASTPGDFVRTLEARARRHQGRPQTAGRLENATTTAVPAIRRMGGDFTDNGPHDR